MSIATRPTIAERFRMTMRLVHRSGWNPSSDEALRFMVTQYLFGYQALASKLENVRELGEVSLIANQMLENVWNPEEWRWWTVSPARPINANRG